MVTGGHQEEAAEVVVVAAVVAVVVVTEEADISRINPSLAIMAIPLQPIIRPQGAAEVTLLEEEAVEGEEDLLSQVINSAHLRLTAICLRQ